MQMKKAIHILSAMTVTVLCIARVYASPSPAVAVKYLQHYGYTKVTNPKLGYIMSGNELNEAVKLFQRFAGLRQSGILDEETLKKMDEPRCGNPDIAGTEYAARKRRYALQGSKWHTNDLTYKISSHTSDLRRHETEKAFDDAFKVWSDVSTLKFSRQRTTSKADIEIEFAKGAHGDGDPFDGKGSTLAHAFFPQFGGNAHFDEDEKWQMDSSVGGTNLKIVAAHELGHSLGLSHSDVTQALMAPFYNKNVKELHKDDIRAIQVLYGKPNEKKGPSTTTKGPRITTKTPTNSRPTKRPVTSEPPVGACNGRFDAITRVHNGSTFAFKGNLFWRLNDNGMDKGYPRTVGSGWGFDGQVDASLTYEGFTDFFQGSQVRRFVNGIAVRGYPKPISEVYEGIPSYIDSAFVWSGNGRIYFMKGDNYWRYNPHTRKGDSGYPRPTKVWKGLPSNIDAALQWKDRTYFFKNGYYWRFDDERVEVAQSLKNPYPRRSDEWWLGCKDNTLMTSFIEGLDKDANDNDGNGGGSKFKVPRITYQIITSTTILLFLATLFS